MASKSRGCLHTSFWRLDKEHGFEDTHFGLPGFEWTYPSLSINPFVGKMNQIIVHLYIEPTSRKEGGGLLLNLDGTRKW